MSDVSGVAGSGEADRTASATTGPFHEDEIRAALASILASDAFTGAARQQRLLRHLVEKRLGGAVSELKEYTLGVEVFDRGENFDSRLDPIVRVEASRLRSRLQKYYEGAGSADPVRITLPRGAYIPGFSAPEPPVAAEAATAPPASEPVLLSQASPAVEPSPLPEDETSLGRRSILWQIGAGSAAILLVTLIFVAVRRPDADSGASDFVKFRRFTSDSSPCTMPAFAPGGGSLVYAKRDEGQWQLFERSLDSLDTKELTAGSGVDNLQPAWAPTGDAIAFRSEREGGGIFRLDMHGQGVSQLTSFGFYPAWSPDGKQIAFSSGNFLDPGENYSTQPSALELIDVESRKVSRLSPPESLRDALQPTWSPDGHRVAFWGTDEDGDRDIWTTSVETTDSQVPQAVRVTHDAWTDWSPAWSPDGRYLYFSSDRGGAMNLWRIRIDESSGNILGGPEPVTTPSSYSGWVSFSSTGKEFAYVHRLVSSQLYRAPFDPEKGVDLDRKTQLTAGERSVREPEVSPDGGWVVIRVQDPQEDLALIRPDGTDLHRITNDAFTDRSPRWAPDGKSIVFLSNRSGRYELWSIRPDGSGLRQITRHGGMSYAWAPDGTLVGFPAEGKPVALDPPGKPLRDWGLPTVFRPMAWSPSGASVVGRMRSNAFGASALFILSPASSDYWEIAGNAPYASTVWLNGGSRLLFSRDDGMYLADVGTHTVRPELSAARAEIHSRFGLSHDNSSIFFVSSDDEEDIWLASE